MMLAGQVADVNDARRDSRAPGSIAELGLQDRHRSMCSPSLTSELREAYFQEGIRPAKYGGEPGQPVFPVDGVSGMGLFVQRQNSRLCRKLRPRQLPADGAGRNRYLRIVPNALSFARIAARHHVELATIFPEPHWGRYFYAALAKRGERNVFLTLDGRGNRPGHHAIVAAD